MHLNCISVNIWKPQQIFQIKLLRYGIVYSSFIWVPHCWWECR